MRIYILIISLFTILPLSAQVFFRVEAEVSIKEIRPDSTQQLMVGNVYFDKNVREIIYDIRFPKNFRFAITDYGMLTDTTKMSFENNFSQHLVDFSVLNLVLNGKLDYFGLDNTQYQLVNARKEADMVISEWELPEEMGSDFGKMLVSQKEGRLFGMVSLNAEGEVVSKQFFTEYQVVRDLAFPTKLIQLSYKDGKSIAKKITTFRNIQLNSQGNEKYHFN